MTFNRALAAALIKICALIGLSCHLAPAYGQDSGLYLFMIQTETKASTAELIDAKKWSLKLYNSNTSKLIQSLQQSGATVLSSNEEYVEFVINSTSTSTSNVLPSAELTDSTFVIDYSESVVLELAEQLRSQLGRSPTVDELSQYVYTVIDNKSYDGTFEIASQVARRKSGDCTEHAVLLAALARYFEMPAQVVLGLMFLEENNEIITAGHAWTKIYYEKKWVLADATRPDTIADQAPKGLQYIPLMQMTNESPGYTFSLLNLNSVFPSKVIEIQPYAN